MREPVGLGERRIGMRRRFASVLLLGVVAASCGGGDDVGPAPGFFESQGTIDWDPVATRTELAERSDRVVIGTLTDVTDGYVFGSSIDDEFGSPVLELLLDVGDVEPFRVMWWYPPGHDLDDVRVAFPIGSRLAVFAQRFEIPAEESSIWHHVGPGDHDHWQWTNPQGLLLEEAEAGEVTWYNAEVTFDDAPPAGSPLAAWVDVELPYDDPELAGFCSSYETAVEEGAPSPWTTTRDAERAFIDDNTVLRGLDLHDGVISLRGEPVGTYELAARAGDTVDVARAEWCHPG